MKPSLAGQAAARYPPRTAPTFMANDPDNPRQIEQRVVPVSGNGDPSTDAAMPPPAAEVQVKETSRLRAILVKVAFFVPALFLFILAIQLMKEGAQAIAPRLQGTFPVDNMISTLGLGWLGAYLVLSGSPVAAAALALFAAGATNDLQAFTMLTGSRLGAAFIVLLVGFLYAMRSRNRQESIGMGVLALSMTAVVYVPGMLIGYGLLKSGVLSGVNLSASTELNTVIDAIWGPFVNLANS